MGGKAFLTVNRKALNYLKNKICGKEGMHLNNFIGNAMRNQLTVVGNI